MGVGVSRVSIWTRSMPCCWRRGLLRPSLLPSHVGTGIVEDLSWGYLDDHRFTLNDTVYTDWCNKFFEPEQCEAPIKMSGYFALRSAKVTYRVSDTV